MGTILKVLVAIPAILFTVFGLRWAVAGGYHNLHAASSSSRQSPPLAVTTPVSCSSV